MMRQVLKFILKANYILYLAAFSIILIAVIAVNENYFEKSSRSEAKNLAQLFATPLWRFDTEAIRYYLLLVIENANYSKVEILDSDRNVIDQEIRSEKVLESFLYFETVMTQKVTFKGQELGAVTIHKKNRNGVLYASLFFVFVIMLLFKTFYQKLKKNKLDMELLFKQSFDYNASIMSIVDLETTAFIDVNNSFLKTFKLKNKKSVIGKTSRELGILEDDVSAKGLMSQLGNESNVHQQEVSCSTSKGDELILFTSVRLIKLESKTIFLFTSIDVTKKRRAEKKLAESNKKLIESARLAGQAEIATGVLHNVGNVLNSAWTSAAVVDGKIKSKQDDVFKQISEYLKKSDHKDEKLISYVEGVAAFSRRMISDSKVEIDNLIYHLSHIREIVRQHQSYSVNAGVLEEISVDQILDDAIKINQGAIERHKIKLICERSNYGALLLDRHRLLQVLINLIRNAKQATSSNLGERIIEITNRLDGKSLIIQVKDNGSGISKENLSQVFSYGFTTKKDGHGFGLHSCANVITEMDGAIDVYSDGIGKGAIFTLTIPIGSIDEQCA